MAYFVRHRMLALTCSLLVGMGALSGCARYGVVDDSTTISYGRAFDGILKNGIRLPPRGDGYWVPRRWDTRDNMYGTDELVTMIVRVARRLRHQTGDVLLGVGDLSPRGGGPSAWHRSHQTGRDVDLLFYYLDRHGRPESVWAMIPVDETGLSRPENDRRWRGYTFDTARNWLLVKEIMNEPTVDVQYLYIYEPLEALLLAHARAIGEDEAFIAQVDALMEQPLNSGLHDDHLHVRLYCPESDRLFGCRDGLPDSWRRVMPAHVWNVYMAGHQLIRAVGHLVAVPS